MAEPAVRLAVVVAALNEAAALPALLADLAAQQGVALQVIVADGGSSDGTPQIATEAGAALVTGHRGRGAQLNAGAAASKAPWLLFLHADTRIPSPTQIAEALALMEAAADPALAGHWPLRFTRSEPGHDYFYRYLEGKTASNRPGTVNGDQGLLLSAAFFRQLGGYNTALPYFEDQRLAARIFAQGRFVALPGLLHTAARRFEAEGHGPRYALMALIVGMEAAGLTALMAELPALYRAQSQAEKLSLAPVLAHIHAHLARLPRAQQHAVWQAVGGLLLGNTWQLAHALDALSPQGQGRVLAAYARHLEPRLGHPVCRSIATRIGEGTLGLCFAAARIRLRLPA